MMLCHLILDHSLSFFSRFGFCEILHLSLKKKRKRAWCLLYGDGAHSVDLIKRCMREEAAREQVLGLQKDHCCWLIDSVNSKEMEKGGLLVPFSVNHIVMGRLLCRLRLKHATALLAFSFFFFLLFFLPAFIDFTVFFSLNLAACRQPLFSVYASPGGSLLF